MAGWLRIAARSFAVAAAAGAAQLGAAQALALLVWSTVPTPEIWRRQLMWLLFIFAAAVLAGVAGGRRSVRAVRQAIINRRAEAAAARNSGLRIHQTGLRAAQQRALAAARYRTIDAARTFAAGASRVSATVFASLGALSAFLLVWLPARNTYASADLRVMLLAASIGTGVGAVVSLLSLLAAPIAANAAVWVAGVWIFGLASVGMAIATDVPTITPRLAVLDAPHLIGDDEWWLGPYLMVGVAGLFGGAVAAGARWIGARRLPIAVSGLAGPAIVAAAYLMVGPTGELLSGYVAALVTATVGLLTSVATALTHREATLPRPAVAISTAAAAATRAIGSRPESAPGRPAFAAAAATGAATAAASPYPPPKPASQYPAAAQYSANQYPTNQYPTWSSSKSTVDADVYVAPPRSAPATRPPVAAPAPAPRPAPRSTPPAPAPPPPTPKATAPAEPPKATPTTQAAPPKAAPPTAAPATAASTPVPAAAPAGTPPKAPAKATGASKAAAEAKTSPATPAGPPTRSKHRGRADRTVRVREPVRPEPVRTSTPDEELPRTARPAEIVAAKPIRSSPAGEPDLPAGRRARRRAAKLAAERAEREARLAKQREREAETLGKREREHIDWVKRLTDMPADPTLTTRRK